MEKCKRAKGIINSLLQRHDLKFDHNKLRKVIEHLNSCIGHPEEMDCIDYFLLELENIKLTDDTVINALVDHLNMQLDVFLDTLQDNDSSTLLDVLTGLYTVFIKLLDPSIANSVETFVQRLPFNSPIGVDYSSFNEDKTMNVDTDVRKRAFLAEKKSQLINELMSIPFNRVLRFLKQQNIQYDQEKFCAMLNKRKLKVFLSELATKVGLTPIELKLYLHCKNDLDAIGCYRKELNTYIISTRNKPCTCTLKNFIQSTPTIPNEILDKSELLKMERLFSKYCHFIRGYKPLEPDHPSEEETGVVTSNQPIERVLAEAIKKRRKSRKKSNETKAIKRRTLLTHWLF